MKNIKKGFTLVELLFVMAIIAILAGFAIANLKDSTTVALKNSMKNDVKNAIATQQTYFAANQAYDFFDSDNGVLNGIGTGDNGLKFSVTGDNHIFSYTASCDDGSEGLIASATNAKLPNYQVGYNSCDTGVIIESDLSGGC